MPYIKAKKIWTNLHDDFEDIFKIFQNTSPATEKEWEELTFKKVILKYGNFVHPETDKEDDSEGVQPDQLTEIKKIKDWKKWLEKSCKLLNILSQDGSLQSYVADGFVSWNRVYSDIEYSNRGLVSYFIRRHSQLRKFTKIENDVLDAIFEERLNIQNVIEAVKHVNGNCLSMKDLDIKGYLEERRKIWKEKAKFIPNSEWILRVNPENFNRDAVKFMEEKFGNQISKMSENEQKTVALLLDNYGVNVLALSDFNASGLSFGNNTISDYRSILSKVSEVDKKLLIQVLGYYPLLLEYIINIHEFNKDNAKIVNFALYLMREAIKDGKASSMALIEPKKLKTFQRHDVVEYSDISQLIKIYDNRKKEMTIPLISGTVNKYRYEIMDRDDTIGLSLGYATDCCMTIRGNGESCIKAGYSNKNSTFFYVQKGKEIYAQSWVWVDEKKGIFCFDSVEVLGDKMTDEYKDILTCYIKAAEELSKTYKVVICGADGNVMPKGLEKIGKKFSKKELSDRNIFCPIPNAYSDLHMHEGGAILIKGEI